MSEKVDNYMSNVRMRRTIEPAVTYDTYPELTSVPRELKMDYSRLIEKPFLLDSFKWNVSDPNTSDIFSLGFPSAIWNNTVASVPWETASLFRTKMCLIIQVMGTPMHMGTLLAASIPYNQLAGKIQDINSYLQAPHVFLSANESTPVCLEVPFYNNTKLMGCDPAGKRYGATPRDYAELRIFNLNGLQAPTGGSTTLSVSVHVKLIDSEFYVPANNRRHITAMSKEFEGQGVVGEVITNVADVLQSGLKSISGDFIDRGRRYFKDLTGLHNPNIPLVDKRVVMGQRNFSNAVDIPTHFEKLDPYANHDRVLTDAVFYTKQDEMLLSNILTKPQYVGSFSVTTLTSEETLLWSRPITPVQCKLSETAPGFSVPLQVFANLSKFWSGSIKVHIQAVMTNFHACKLIVYKNYSPDVTDLTTAPSLLDFRNLLTDTLEFSGGGQVQTIELPYCSFLDELPCVAEPQLNALSHGVYYIALNQLLVSNGSVPTTVRFNVYISAGDDFNFYGYATERMQVASDSPSLMVDEPEFEGQAEVMVDPSHQMDITNKPPNPTATTRKFPPIVSVRDYMRRFAVVKNANFTTEANPKYGVMFIPVNELVGLFNKGPRRVTASTIVRKYFYGMSGGYKIKLQVIGATSATVRYIPPQPTYDSGYQYWRGSSPISNSPTLVSLINRSFWYPHRDIATPYVDDYSPCPYQEVPQTYGTSSSHQYTGDLIGTSDSNIQFFEFTIPQMNGCEFLGSHTLQGQGQNERDYTADLGWFAIGLDNWNPETGLYNDTLSMVSASVAYADEARLGFNVKAPFVSYDFSGPNLAGPYQNWDGNLQSYLAANAAQAYVGG